MKKTKRENMRVVVEPDMRYMCNPKEEYVKNICETIKQQITRHADEIGDIYIEWDTLVECEYCGWGWELDGEGIPVCCNKAIEEWEKEICDSTGEECRKVSTEETNY